MQRGSVRYLLSFSACMAVSGALHAADYLVENLNNSGAGTLRAAITSANANPGADTIEFQAGLNGSIVLASALPPISDDVTISGPGAAVITISGNSVVQPFFISGGSTVTLTGLTIANGRSGIGGAIGNQGNLTVADCVLSNNHAVTDGGAIDNFGGSLTVSQSRLTGNTTGATGVGGGISNDGGGTISITESTFTGNTADYGGALDNNQGTVTILRSTFSANGAGEDGGAVSNVSTLTVRNSTFSGNSAGTSGGGIDNFRGEATVEFSTLTGNSAGSGGGIDNDATITLKNTIIVNNVAGNNCAQDPGGTFTTLGANFSTDASCSGFTQVTTGEINLGPLADNGGPTLTHALLAASVATDAALDCTRRDGATAVTEDQRGQPRPAGAECDSGAFEGSVPVSETIFRDGFESE